MSLSAHQAAFSQDMAYMIVWVPQAIPGARIRVLEVKRHELMQRIYKFAGKSWTLESSHLDALAFDCALDIDGVWQESSAAYRPLGVKWEELSKNNRWGGRFRDGNHFERMTRPRDPVPLEA